MAAPVVVYDANVLYPAPLRDLLIRLARTGEIRARWTEQILDECIRNILAKRPDLQASSLERTRELMGKAIPDVLVTDHARWIDSIVLPDRDDRHVVAAAIAAGACEIVTFNLRDFPATALAGHGITATHPDAFVARFIERSPAVSLRVVEEQAAALRNPPTSVDDLLDRFTEQGLVQSVARLRVLRSSPPR